MGFDQKNHLAASIARAAAVFCVDEVIVFDDDPSTISPYLQNLRTQYQKGKNATKAELQALVDPAEEGYHNPDQFLFHLLNYLECPPFLRVPLIAKHPNLNKAGVLPSTDMPHHLRAHDWCQYREGMVVDTKEVEAYYGTTSSKNSKSSSKSSSESFSYVDCGLTHPVRARTPIPAPVKTRVTIKFANSTPPPSWPELSKEETDKLEVDIVSPDAPREQGGIYWGYHVRRAASVSSIFEDSTFEGGYDASIGTSERGVPLSSLVPTSTSLTPATSPSEPPSVFPQTFNHLLVVIGGREGIEPAVASDPKLKAAGLTKETAHQVFDYWVNLVPGQGSRTIRTEEAVWIALMGLRPWLDGLGEKDE
jgi:predicted SPOUT superfamily RNA methylase MTH1